MAQKVLITGGTGYIGSILTEHLLSAGNQVTILDNLMFSQRTHFHFCANANYQFVYGDVRSESTLKKLVAEADVIIPLAALVGAPICDQDPWAAKAINFDAVKLINSMRSSSQLLIYPMTNSGYGTKSGEMHCTEDSALEPISLYGRTKVDGEQEILSKPNSISLRLATVFGMSPRLRLDLLVNYFTYMAFSEGYIVIFEKDFKRNFVHVRDVADCFLHCMKNSERMQGKPYNVGLDSANMSKEELATKVKKYVPNFYIHYSEVGNDPDKRNYIVSNKRLADAGFTASRSIDEGIQELLKGYQMLRRSGLKNV